MSEEDVVVGEECGGGWDGEGSDGAGVGRRGVEAVGLASKEPEVLVCFQS